jgi:hypothetical protein
VAALTMTPDDLSPFAEIPVEKAQTMIDDAMAMAALVAPCILEETFANEAAARAIIRGAILRWNEAGTGAYTQRSAGSVQVSTDTRQPRKGMFWPTEIDQLQKLCATTTSGAFSISMLGASSIHQPWCSLHFGATYCSCGADIAGEPIYEL